MDNWIAIAGFAAALVAIVLALPPTLTALRDLRSGARRARQQILDALPNPQPRPVRLADASEDPWHFVESNGLDASELHARLAAPPAEIRRELKRLIAEDRVQVALRRFEIEDHPALKSGVLPIFYKGGLDPSLRASVEEAGAIVDQFWGPDRSG